MPNDELRNQLKSQSLGNVDAAAFKQVGGAVFPDVNASKDLEGFKDVVSSYQATHLPAYGQRIPNSFAKESTIISTSTTTATLLTVPAGEMWIVDAIARTSAAQDYSVGDSYLTNGGVAVADLRILDTSLADTSGLVWGRYVGLTAISTANVGALDYIVVDGGQTLAVEFASAPSNELKLTTTYFKLSQ